MSVVFCDVSVKDGGRGPWVSAPSFIINERRTNE
nr:MAG TPA: SpoVG [Caudoviricetes sp.]DAS21049.1 MAG TPA: SpoVG [Caudoviricetes sp.]